ncbi:MAG: TetR family transcriptional regulator [Phycisphaerales bacterium]
MKKQNEKMKIPVQERAVKSREKILSSAQRVFSQKGLHGARIDEIARLANINKQRIYAYFSSKKNLYHQVLIAVYSLAASNEKIIALREEDIPRMTFKIIESFLDFHQKHPEFWRLLAWENLNGGKSLKNEDWKAIRSSYVDHIKNLFEIGKNQGFVNVNVDFSTYILTIFSITYFYFSNQLTISHLLNLDLESITIRQQIAQQLNSMFAQNNNS